MDGWKNLPVTINQWKAISNIQYHTKHKFGGRTRGGASRFISEHMDESVANAEKAAAAKQELQWEEIYDEVMQDVYIWGRD